MRAFRPSNVFYNFSTMHPKPNKLFSGSDKVKFQVMTISVMLTNDLLYKYRLGNIEKGDNA